MQRRSNPQNISQPSAVYKPQNEVAIQNGLRIASQAVKNMTARTTWSAISPSASWPASTQSTGRPAKDRQAGWLVGYRPASRYCRDRQASGRCTSLRLKLVDWVGGQPFGCSVSLANIDIVIGSSSSSSRRRRRRRRHASVVRTRFCGVFLRFRMISSCFERVSTVAV